MKAEELKKLIIENPELDIVTMVNYEVCASDDYTYWLGIFLKAEVTEMLVYSERVYHSKDFDELSDVVYDILQDDYKLDGKDIDKLSEDKIEKLIKDKIQEMIKEKKIEDLGKVICIFIDN